MYFGIDGIRVFQPGHVVRIIKKMAQQGKTAAVFDGQAQHSRAAVSRALHILMDVQAKKSAVGRRI